VVHQALAVAGGVEDVQGGGFFRLDLNSSDSGCARLGSGVALPLGVVKEEVMFLSLKAKCRDSLK